MPAIAVHTWLAMELMERWPQQLEPRLDWRLPELRNAFFNGCMGPDMGLFPGADAFLSDVVHYVSTAQLVRNLLNTASKPIEHAYAIGWASHFWADVRLHPVVNRGVREALYPDRSQPVPYGDDPLGHVLVEVGVDGVWYQTHKRIESGSFRACFDKQSIKFVADALKLTYGDVWSEATVLASHRACARFGRLLLRAFRVHGARIKGKPVQISDWPFWLGVMMPLRCFKSLLPAKSPLRGIIKPLPPSDALMQDWETVTSGYVPEFFDLMKSKFVDAANFNMDLGELEVPSDPYPLAQQAREKLLQLGGRIN